MFLYFEPQTVYLEKICYEDEKKKKQINHFLFLNMTAVKFSES